MRGRRYDAALPARPLTLPSFAPKAPGVGHDRELTLVQAVARVPRLRERFRITRIGETTRLDRAGVPTVCAIVPESPDDLSIYNGKGVTREASLVSAVMETVERQTAAYCAIPQRIRRADRVKRGLDLRICGIRDQYADAALPHVRACDLRSGEPMEVPTALVQMPWRGLPAFETTHTNGIASGFTITEAIHHALFELLERHLWAVTHAHAHLRPARVLRKVLGPGEFAYMDDPVSEVAQPTGSERVDVLCDKFARTGLRVRLVAMREPRFPAAILASLHDTGGEVERLHVGCGCAWSPVDAAVRALTEAAQARVADIQGARENILRSNDPPSTFSDHTRRRARLPHGRWYFDGPVQRMAFAELHDGSSDDLADELRRLIDAVAGIASRIALVDLSPPDRSFAVVRVIVPELETTLMDGRVGPIAQAIVEAAS